ncbi:Organic cation/carnitine transporter 3 [Morus notabilis]|uniref:Organic cation/carnitine transporter 3 n=1 Tax=Morus notabilis TaxID=981085 RepID=W9R1E5_9ROSA|nr:organic cation/carnitine transporter 3 [Morus notabilis]EXB51241.1 Organic cation/carnitine transporter 3 [Morus notabilis]
MAEADSTPLLSQISNSEPPLLEKHLPSLDSTIEKCIGDFSWSQFLQAMLVSFAWFFDAQQTFISVFTDAEPKSWHCKTTTESCNSASSDICLLSRDSWDWDFPKQKSTISEFSLECSGSLVTGLPASAFFIGCLIGGLLLATLADSSLGRKTMLFVSCLVMALSTLFTAVFSTNIWIYSALRFVGGFGRATIGTCALVLSTELVGRRWRGQVGVMGFVFFTLGFLSLPAMAYANRESSWRNLYVWTSVPTIFYSMAVYFLVYESPRWLFVRGRKEDAVKNMAQISNNQNIIMSFSSMAFEEETWNVDLYSAIKILVKKKWAFRRLSAVMAIGFGTGMVYYGMPLALGDLDFNLYLSIAFNALSELPSSLVTFFLVENLNRKSSLLFFTSLSGICSIMSVLRGKIWTRLQIGFELVSFFSACTAFDMLLIFTIELFPTCVRNSAVAMVRQALVFGGVFSPVLAAAGRGSDGFVSYGVFGIVIGCFGLFVVCLPETRGRGICDTMDEEEHKDKFVSCIIEHGSAGSDV